MKFLTYALIILFAVSCANTGSRYSTSSDFYYNQLTQHDVIDIFVMQPDVVREIKRMPAILRPAESDYLTLETDLNGDGKPDILAAINNYKFDINKKHKLFVFLKNDYSYTQIKPYVLIDSYDLTILDTVTNGMRDFSVSSKIFRFDGKNYL